MRIWVTRAEPGASRTAARLRAAGFTPVTAPLLELYDLPGVEAGVEGAGALAFTSAAGVGAFAARTDAGRALPVFTVGDATAEAARAAGFADVRSADGDGAALARLIAASRGGFVDEVRVPGAREPAFDLPAALAAEGIGARSVALYAARPAEATPPPLLRALQEGPVDAVLIHSPAAARALEALDPETTAALAEATLLCLSPACAEAAPAGLTGARRIARRPREDALLELLTPGRSDRPYAG